MFAGESKNKCAASGVDVSVISELKGKDVMLGVIDVGTDEVETTELVASRIRKALQHVIEAEDKEHKDDPEEWCGKRSWADQQHGGEES